MVVKDLRICVYFIATLMATLGGIKASTPIKYMVNTCKKGTSLHVNSSIILELTAAFAEDRTHTQHLHCAANIVVERHQRIFLHFLSLDISDHTVTPDRLHIYDYNDDGMQVRVTPPMGLYGVFQRPLYDVNTAGIPMTDYKSSGNKLRLDYSGSPTDMYRGFQILVTVFSPPTSRGGCPIGFLGCRFEKMCIAGSLRCDGQSNCGDHDGSDEQDCRVYSTVVVNLHTTNYIAEAAIVAGLSCISFLLFAVVVVIIVIKFNKRRGFKYNEQQKKRISRARAASAEEERAARYAPPAYKDVIGDSDDCFGPPPDYSSLAANRVQQAKRQHSSTSVEVAIMHPEPRVHYEVGTEEVSTSPPDYKLLAANGPTKTSVEEPKDQHSSTAGEVALHDEPKVYYEVGTDEVKTSTNTDHQT